MAEAAFNNKRALITSTLDLELRKKLVKCITVAHVLREDSVGKCN